DPGQWRAKTIMTGPCEGDVSIVLTAEVHSIRVREPLRVAVCGPHDCDNRLPLADPLASQLYIIRRQPRCVLAPALVAQPFLDCAGHQVLIAPELLQLSWML